MTIDLRPGRWEDVLADVTADCLIVDAPYSAKTHDAYSPHVTTNTTYAAGARWAANGGVRRSLNYDGWGPADVQAFVSHWHGRTRGWFVSLTDSELAPAWADALRSAGRYVFSPIACVEPGSRVRLAGDGPAQWSVWAIVARPAALHKWGALPGAYVVPNGHGNRRADRGVVGGKPLWLMRALVRDYSRAGDVVCDPCAGAATTLIAAATEGRAAIGAEALPEHYQLARARIDRGYTPALAF